MFALGMVLYAVLFRFIVKAQEEERIKNSLLIGFGLTLVLHALAIRLWTADERSVTTAYAGAVLRLGPIALPLIRAASVLLAFTLLMALQWFLSKARWGRAIRATAEDWEAASLMGIPVGRTYLLAFALGTALAGIAGGLVSISYSISPSIGMEWTLKALIVIVLAGLGSLFGSFAGGILLGLAEAMSVVFLGGPYREVVGLILFLFVLLVRPQGLFGARS
jgi:branched-chain amino acid transport system permease protein